MKDTNAAAARDTRVSDVVWTLPLAAATVGALHTLAPDHWI
ncbi:MAG TPA: hypothetical protein VEK57_13415 [Thermoanaerobaculia bacterium]|nr:hypothetical protein [Thermoanaerobaculia bacterium]